jgi:hypothetical protein
MVIDSLNQQTQPASEEQRDEQEEQREDDAHEDQRNDDVESIVERVEAFLQRSSVLQPLAQVLREAKERIEDYEDIDQPENMRDILRQETTNVTQSILGKMQRGEMDIHETFNVLQQNTDMNAIMSFTTNPMIMDEASSTDYVGGQRRQQQEEGNRWRQLQNAYVFFQDVVQTVATTVYQNSFRFFSS